jgi:hypothetical protein
VAASRVFPAAKLDDRVLAMQTVEDDEDLPRPSVACAWLGHSTIESIVRSLGIEVDDAIEIAETIEL